MAMSNGIRFFAFKAQRRRLIKFLKDIIQKLETAPGNLKQAPDAKAIPAPEKKAAKRAPAKAGRKAAPKKKKLATA